MTDAELDLLMKGFTLRGVRFAVRDGAVTLRMPPGPSLLSRAELAMLHTHRDAVLRLLSPTPEAAPSQPVQAATAAPKAGTGPGKAPRRAGNALPAGNASAPEQEETPKHTSATWSRAPVDDVEAMLGGVDDETRQRYRDGTLTEQEAREMAATWRRQLRQLERAEARRRR